MSQPNPREATEQLILRLQELVTRLQAEQGETLPPEPYLESESALKGTVKRSVFRATRTATRRSDRLATELAMVAVELAEQLRSANIESDRLRGDIDRLDHAVGSLRASQSDEPGRGPAGDAETVPDAFYWSFEDRMRGSSASVIERLARYERPVVSLREALVGSAGQEAEPPLWLDLGSGEGAFCELVRAWGWRVEGMDRSPSAVEVSRSKGIDTTLADVDEFLLTRRGPAPGAISAIQLIEHLPPQRWIGLFEHVRSLLVPGGAFLVETINGLNPEAVAAYFTADVTHTWPGHPETLKLMAEYSGFDRAEVDFINPDHRGNAQDFALWARMDVGSAVSGSPPASS